MEQAGTLKILRDGTTWFIDQDATQVQFRRSQASVGPGGGRIKGTPVTLPALRVKLIHQGGNGISNGEGGRDTAYDYVIVADWDADIKKGDEFTIEGQKFIVESLDPFNGYEVKAYARQHGKAPTDG
ncbi:head-to-tail stopper [Gordonia phage LittleFella]|nr:head-to-tail stopper [Gordonia phage LittleFella]